jgi:hypothetical protein
MNDGITLRFDAPDGNRTVVLEDDGKVAYAYLLEHDEVVGDVWLYNVATTPDTVDWKDRNAMPFLNPRKYCLDGHGPTLRNDSAVICHWSDDSVDVVIEGVRMARLARGAKPGWSRLASARGPLAQPLDN